MLLNGDTSLKLLMENKKMLHYIIEVEQYLKENTVDSRKIASFIEEFMMIEA